MTQFTSKGFRLNNHGNIKHSNSDWLGKSKTQDDPVFVTFTTPIYGIRAIARILLNYQGKHKLYTVKDIISRWAPPSDNNNTLNYVAFVSSYMDVSPIDTVNLAVFDNMRKMVEAIIDFENSGKGFPYSDAEIAEAIKLAGIKPPPKDLADSRTIKGGRLANTSVVGALLTELATSVAAVRDYIEPYAMYFEWLKYVLLVSILVGVGITIYARIDDKLKGVR